MNLMITDNCTKQLAKYCLSSRTNKIRKETEQMVNATNFTCVNI